MIVRRTIAKTAVPEDVNTVLSKPDVLIVLDLRYAHMVITSTAAQNVIRINASMGAVEFAFPAKEVQSVATITCAIAVLNALHANARDVACISFRPKRLTGSAFVRRVTPTQKPHKHTMKTEPR